MMLWMLDSSDPMVGVAIPLRSRFVSTFGSMMLLRSFRFVD